MIRKAAIVLLALFAIAAAWWQLISIPVFFVGIIAFLATSRQPNMRRKLRLTGLALTFVVLTLWLTSMRYAFGCIGSTACVYFESGSYAVFATHGQIPATGLMGVGRSRWDVFWWFSCPAMIPLTPVWMPLLAVLTSTSLLCIRCHRFPPGHCRKCGYNLTGNESGVCPECGEAIPRDSRDG